VSEKPDGALSRWSQRKHAARVAARGGAAPTALKEADEPVVSDVQPQLAPDARANLPADASGAERKAERTPVELRPPLTPIEELTAESDYTQFLAEHVPEALRRAALRKLWNSDPVLACLDGLNDYDEDYNVIDTAISVADTDYKIGRGFLDADEPESERMPERVAAARGEAEPAGGPAAQATESDASADERIAQDDSQDSTDEDGARRLVADAAEEAPSNSQHESPTGSKG
jgi:hypothetical protein